MNSPSSSLGGAVPAKPRIAVAVVRVLMGLAMTVFGLNGFLNFIPQPTTPIAEGAAAFGAALFNTGYMMQLIGATMLISGVFLLTNRFVPLALAFLAPFFVNSLAFHICLERSGLVMSGVFVALELYLAWSYRGAYRSMLAARVSPT